MGNENEEVKAEVLVEVVYLGEDLKARKSPAKVMCDGAVLLVDAEGKGGRVINAGHWLLKSEYLQMASEIAVIRSRKKASVRTSRRVARARKVGVL